MNCPICDELIEDCYCDQIGLHNYYKREYKNLDESWAKIGMDHATRYDELMNSYTEKLEEIARLKEELKKYVFADHRRELLE